MSTRESPSSSTHRAGSKGRWLAVFVVLLALVLVLEFSFGFVSSALSGTTHAVTLATDTEAARAGDVGVETPRAESDGVAVNDRENTARARRSPTLSARLVDPQGNALEAMIVDAIAVDEEHRFDRQPGAAGVLARATSSRDGRIAVPMPREGFVALALRGQPFVLTDRYCHFAVSESDVDVGDLACRRASSLTGTVVDASGTPVANAECHAWIDTTMDAVVTRTDAQGSFVLAGFSTLPSKVTARAAGHGIAHATPVDFETPLVLRLDYLRTAVLEVKEHGSDRRIEHASVERGDLPAGMNRFVPRRGDGKFEFDITSVGAVLRCSARGYAPVRAFVFSNVSVYEVELEELTSVEGRVVDRNGEGVAVRRIDLTVVGSPIEDARGSITTMAETVGVATDDAGRFAFPDVVAGETILMPAGAPEPTKITTKPGKRTTGVRVVIDRPIVCSCIVVDPSGKPIAGASLRLARDSNRAMRGLASTGRDGRATLHLTKADTYRIRVSKQGWATAQATVDPNSSEPWRITLQPAARVRVEVVDATAKPVPNAAVFACLEEDSRVCVYGHADGRGVVRFDDLVPGLWKFQVRRTSRGDFVVGRFSSDSLVPDSLTTKSAVLRAGSESEVTLTFGSLQKCTVRVRWKGRDLAKARVVFFDARGSAVSAFTNEQGRALLVKSGFGKGRVVVDPEGMPFTFTHELEVPRGRAESFETIDLAGATLVVIAPSDVSEAKPVQLFKGAEVLRITTPGRVVVEPVPPGVFTLRKQGSNAAARFAVKAGDYLEKVVPN